jgi:hypothetical protein
MKKSAITFFVPIEFALVGLFLIVTGFLPIEETKTYSQRECTQQIVQEFLR